MVTRACPAGGRNDGGNSALSLDASRAPPRSSCHRYCTRASPRCWRSVAGGRLLAQAGAGGLTPRRVRAVRAVFFNRLGELRDRSFENQRYRASGLNLVIAAIVLWNTTYLERTVAGLPAHGHTVDDALLPHLSPLGWEHINLTGDYLWRQSKQVERGKFRSPRRFGIP